MKKFSKLVALSLVTAMAFTGCGSSSSNEESKSGNSSSTEEGTSLKVAMVTDTGGINDQSFNQSAWAGLQQAEEQLGIEVDYLESSTEADYASNIDTLVDEEYDLIIGVGFLMADAIKNAATSYPDQKFAIIDDSTNADLENVSCLMFEQAQASYLVGCVAGKMTETNNVGFVLGMGSEVMHQFGYGYIAGILDSNPDCEVQQYDVNSFADSAGGKTATVSMYTNGADIVFHAAGSTGLGVIEAAKEQGKYAIGVDQDQAYLAEENVLTSAMKRVDQAVFNTCEDLSKGEFQSGVVTYDLASGGVGISETQDLLTDEVIAYVEEVEEKIIAGEIEVPKTQADFEEAYGEIYTLD